ncbi:hypothetical protein SRABI96_02548 [Peribacillus sp. Bi96]|nr:hypothetical protein SRABI96_02548 [Peribacillus sp. Bi96]
MIKVGKEWSVLEGEAAYSLNKKHSKVCRIDDHNLW